MPLEFRCPYCGQVISAPDEAAGVTGTCRFCGAAVVAPALAGQPAELAQPGNPEWAATSPSMPTGEINPQTIASESWRTLWGNLGTILGAVYASAFVILLVGLPVMLPLAWPWFQSVIANGPEGAPAMPTSVFVAMLFVSLLVAPIQAGPLYVIDRLLARGDGSLGAIFFGLRQYRAIVIYTFVYGAPQWVVSILQVLTMGSNPALSNLLSFLGFVVSATMWVVFSPGLMEIVDRGAEPIDALRTSLEITRGKRLSILGAGALLLLIMAAGYIVCCVGVLVTLAVIPVGQVVIYRHLRGLQGTRY